MNIEELESSLKAFDPELIFRRGPDNLSLDVIGRLDRKDEDNWDLKSLSDWCNDCIYNLCNFGAISYFSTGCNQNAATYSVTFNLKPKEQKPVCPGCERDEIHKMCPAYGTEYYMSGKLFTKEIEESIKNSKP